MSEQVAPKTEPWHLNFIQHRYTRLLEFVEAEMGEEGLERALQCIGRTCACNCAAKDLPIKQRGNPGGYFEAVHELWGEDFEFDQEREQIIVRTNLKACMCPLYNHEHRKREYCNCSIGWQTRMFETLFERPVDVTIVKSIQRGDETCEFRVKLL
jgi:hypothetical protein